MAPSRKLKGQHANLKPNDFPPNSTADMTYQRAICAFIRQGAYPHVAAQAIGLPAALYERWMNTGLVKTRSLFGMFRLAVLEAQAQARLKAEQALFEKDPVAWLRSGPGKERPGDPGWSSTPKPVVLPASQVSQVNVFSGELALTMQKLLAALAPFPEARLAAASVLGGVGEQPIRRIAVIGGKTETMVGEAEELVSMGESEIEVGPNAGT